MATPLAVAGDAMETLKMKIFMLKKENTDVSEKMESAEKDKTEANARLQEAEKKIKELSKQIHTRKLLLDDHTDRLQKNTHMIKRKEEATIAAKEEIKAQTLREMQLQSEVERVLTALPETQNKLTAASEKADTVLSEVKKMEIRAMLTDQTIEEMEAGLSDAHNMSANTAAKAEDMAKKLSVRSKELGRAQDRAEQAHNKLETVTEKLRKADIKMASLQFNLEDRSRMDSKYKKQIMNLQAKIKNEDERSARDEELLEKLNHKKEHIVELRKKKAEEKSKKKKK